MFVGFTQDTASVSSEALIYKNALLLPITRIAGEYIGDSDILQFSALFIQLRFYFVVAEFHYNTSAMFQFMRDLDIFGLNCNV